MNRILLLDNAKFLMIFLVVFAHLIMPLVSQHSVIETMLKIIMSFVMPVFIFISGLLTKQKTNEDYEMKLIKSILFPFIIFTFFYEILEIILNGTVSDYTKTLSPYWSLWFLFSLFCWKIIAPLFIKLRYPILTSIVFLLIGGYFDSIGYFLGLSRTLYYFPFFLIGFKLTPETFLGSKLFNIPKVFFISILILNILLFILLPEINYTWLFGSLSYYKMGITSWQAPLIRLGLLSLSFISSIAILFLIPTKRTFFSRAGTKSIYVYLWHGFFVKILCSLKLFAILNEYFIDIIIFSIIIIITSIITFVCSTEALERLTNRLIINPASKLLLGDIKYRI